jgi:cold shock CspA family protein
MDQKPQSIPSPLVDAVREGRAVLFLGSGASYGAIHPSSKTIPQGNQLRDLICDKFLNGDLKTSSLIECSDYAIDSHDLNIFQQFIRDVFDPFQPADFHKLIPTFNWNSMFTTNYDLIIERAYADPSAYVQYVKEGQKVDWELRNKPNSILLTKLHGSIDHYLDSDIPLVLSSDQYVSVSKNRKMLFDRFLTLGSQFPVIFVGYRATDLHIKTIFNELGKLGQRRPRYFYVSPNISSYQLSYLETRRTTCIPLSFEQFLSSLDKELLPSLRVIKIDINKALDPLRKHIRVPQPRPSGDLVSFLSTDVDYIYSTMPIEAGKSAEFYEGIPQGFYPITQNLDVRREKKTDTLLSDVFFRGEAEEDSSFAELCVIKGAAGSGKSVFLRRLAWEAAINFDCLCLYHRRTGALRFSAIYELYSLTSSRIFLFVDRAAYFTDEIENLLSNAKANKIPLTIVTAERHNEWNVRCEKLERYVTYEDEVSRLSSGEIAELVTKLRDAKALGKLTDKSNDECKEIFEQKLGRQLLVALHEATKGKTFEEIVVDQYNRIIPIEAQLLYLDICTFQRLGAELRAGLISRIGGVTFEEFKERLLRPLEQVVFISEDRYGRDHLYRAKHQRIAEIVFDQVLATQKQKYDTLIRLLKGINRDYSVDNEAFESLMHGAVLRAIFSNVDLARQLLDEGLALTHNDDFVLHQRAVFELQHSDGDPSLAIEFIDRALAKKPNDKAKLNTKANALRRLAQESANEIKRNHFRSQAIEVLNSIAAKDSRDFVLYANILVDELDELIKASPQGHLSERALTTKVQDIEHTLARAYAASPADPFVLQVEARYRDVLQQDQKAFSALKKANDINPSIAPLARRLSRVYQERHELKNAFTTLVNAIERNPTRELWLELGKLITEHPEFSGSYDPITVFRNSFDNDDDQIIPRLYLLREFWHNKQIDNYRELQRSLRRIPAPRHLRSEPGLLVKDKDGQSIRFRGVVRVKEADYAFLKPDDGYPDVFIHRGNIPNNGFDSLQVGSSIWFNVGFTTRGAAAVA